MKLFKQMFYVALISIGGCGDGGTAVDFAAYLPKLSPHDNRAGAEMVRRTEPARVVAESTAPVVATPGTVDAALAQGRALLGNGDTAGAKALFETAVKLDPKAAEPHMELARLYISANERGHAMAEANKAVKLAPLSSQAWNTKGRAELHRFSYDDAILAFSRAVEINPDNVWAWNNLGYTELQLKNYGDAAEYLAEATSRPGATGYMFNNLGTALEQLDRLDEARAAFEAGGKLGSKHALASRQRLEGVKSIALVLPPGKPEIIDSPGFAGARPSPGISMGHSTPAKGVRSWIELKGDDEHDRVDADDSPHHPDEPTGQDGFQLDGNQPIDAPSTNDSGEVPAIPLAE